MLNLFKLDADEFETDGQAVPAPDTLILQDSCGADSRVALPPPTLGYATAPQVRLGRGVMLALGLHAAVLLLALGVWRHAPAKSPEGRAIAVTLETLPPGTTMAGAPMVVERAPAAAARPAEAVAKLLVAKDGAMPVLPPVAARVAHEGKKGETAKPAPAPVASVVGAAPPGGAEALVSPLGATRPAKADKETTVFYSMLSRETDQQGVVTLNVPVAADGTPGPVSVARSSGYADLDNVARSAVQSWHFQPALKNGVPVASVLTYKFRFELN